MKMNKSYVCTYREDLIIIRFINQFKDHYIMIFDET